MGRVPVNHVHPRALGLLSAVTHLRGMGLRVRARTDSRRGGPKEGVDEHRFRWSGSMVSRLRLTLGIRSHNSAGFAFCTAHNPLLRDNPVPVQLPSCASSRRLAYRQFRSSRPLSPKRQELLSISFQQGNNSVRLRNINPFPSTTRSGLALVPTYPGRLACPRKPVNRRASFSLAFRATHACSLTSCSVHGLGHPRRFTSA